MDKHYILVIDIGTQSLKSAIVDEAGKTVAFAKETYDEPYFSPKNGYAEQRPDFYFEHLAKATNSINEQQPGIMTQIKSVILTCFRDTAALLDEEYEPVIPSILWLDQRMAKLKKKIGFFDSLIFSLVRMKDTVVYNKKRTPAIWLQENDPETWKKIKYYVPLTAYLNYKLTGNLVDSAANCTGHYPINFKKGKWYSTIHPKFRAFGIKKSQLCKVVSQGSIIGTVTAECSKITGIPEGTNLYACSTDKSCETFGNGCFTDESASISLGTACTIDVPSKRYAEPEKHLPAYPGVYKGIYNLEVQIYRGYWMLTWFKQNFATEEMKKEAEEKGISLLELYNKKMTEIDPGSNGLILQPYWGPGLKRPLARGAIIGFSDTHNSVHVYRSIIEGIGFALKEGLVSIQKSLHCKIKYIAVSGGGAVSDEINQIMCNLFNLPVMKVDTEYGESGILGAAAAGFIFEGLYKDELEVKEHMIKYKKVYTPDVEVAKKYQELFDKVYTKIYPQLNKMYAKLKEYSTNEIH